MQKQRDGGVPTEREPEYVGVHSGIVNDTCQSRPADPPEIPDQCGNEATHTKILFSGKLIQIAVCDECGAPEDLPDREREWSGT